VYKKIISSILLFVLLAGCSVPQNNNEEATEKEQYVKAVWITYYELSAFTVDNSESEFKKNINKTFKKLSSNGFNRVTVQVRPCADAFYNSSYFPVSEYCFGSQDSELKYDPLKIMTDLAHKHNLSIEAWINPYRVSQSQDYSKIGKNNIALKWKGSERLIEANSALYFNPAYDEVTELIVNGVKEIAENYNIDSICFDDYFYPCTDSDIDKIAYDEYKKSGGDKNLSDWRRENVSNMVRKVYETVKSVNKNITFGISPASNIENNYAALYADVEKWCKEEGFVDYICPQIYFGFKNEAQPFMKTTKLWTQTANCDLYVALPLYKSGKEDEYAGTLGENEFKDNDNIIARQVEYLSKLDDVNGYYIFSYSSLKENNETKNLYSAMQNSSE